MTEIQKKQISNQLRELVCTKYTAGLGPTQISEDLSLNIKTVTSIINVFKKTGRIHKIDAKTGRPKSLNCESRHLIQSQIDNDVSTTLKTIKAKLGEEQGVNVSESTIHRAIADFNYTLKRVCLIPERRNTLSNIESRFNYAADFMLFDEEKMLFIDEMGLSVSMRIGYGRSRRGTQAVKRVRAIRSKNYSTAAAMNKNGIMHFKVSDKAFNSNTFGAFLSEVNEKLRIDEIKNAVIIMDNASIHKTDEIREIFNNSGHILVFLPPYSPQLNPIEEVFSKWKQIVKTMNCAYSEDLLRAIDLAHTQITSENCFQYFLHMKIFIRKATLRETF